MELSRKQKIYSINLERNDVQGHIIVSDESVLVDQLNHFH